MTYNNMEKTTYKKGTVEENFIISQKEYDELIDIKKKYEDLQIKFKRLYNLAVLFRK